MRRMVHAAMMAVGLMGLQATDIAALERTATPGQDAGSVTMRVYGAVHPPFGYVSFCERYPADCEVDADGDARMTLTGERWSELVQVNKLINELVEPVTDAELYKTIEYWAYPAGRGDCEDYVLAKRRLLIQYGWPAASLRITVVRDEEGLGHAVLTAVTDRGDMVLDNKLDEVAAWRDTPYTFQKRQSPGDSMIWESLNVNNELRQRMNDPVAAR